MKKILSLLFAVLAVCHTLRAEDDNCKKAAVPADLKAELTAGVIKITWTHVTTCEHGGAYDAYNSQYHLLRKPDNKLLSGWADAVKNENGVCVVEDINTLEDRDYYYELVLKLQNVSSAVAKSNTFTSPVAPVVCEYASCNTPATPEVVKAEYINGNTAIHVAWSDVSKCRHGGTLSSETGVRIVRFPDYTVMKQTTGAPEEGLLHIYDTENLPQSGEFWYEIQVEHNGKYSDVVATNHLTYKAPTTDGPTSHTCAYPAAPEIVGVRQVSSSRYDVCFQRVTKCKDGYDFPSNYLNYIKYSLIRCTSTTRDTLSMSADPAGSVTLNGKQCVFLSDRNVPMSGAFWYEMFAVNTAINVPGHLVQSPENSRSESFGTTNEDPSGTCGVPGTPENVVAELQANGTVVIKWNCLTKCQHNSVVTNDQFFDYYTKFTVTRKPDDVVIVKDKWGVANWAPYVNSATDGNPPAQGEYWYEVTGVYSQKGTAIPVPGQSNHLGTPSGINVLHDDCADCAVAYDLSGRRVEAATANGLVVVNGERRLVR